MNQAPQDEILVLLEAPLVLFKSLSDFLKSDQALENYYQVCLQVYGEERDLQWQFQKLLSQMRELVKEVPECAERIWNRVPTQIPSFEIPVKEKSFGRVVNSENWSSFVLDWVQSLELKIGGRFGFGTDGFLTRVRSEIERWSFEIRSFEEQTRALQKKINRTRSRRLYYAELKKKTEFCALAAALLYQFLKYRAQNVFISNDADLILNSIEDWRQNAGLLFSSEQDLESTALKAAIRDLIPNRQSLLKNEELFPPQNYKTLRGRPSLIGVTKRGKYSFAQIPRAFHAIWRGLFLNDCVGGTNLELITPARWAMPLLKDCVSLHISRNGHFEGYISFIPVQFKEQTYTAVEFVCPSLAKMLRLDTAKKPAPFLSWVLMKLSELHFLSSAGLVFGDSQYSQDGGTQWAMELCPQVQLSKVLGPAQEFALIDQDLAKRILSQAPHSPEIDSYSKGMMYTLSYADAKLVRLLAARPKI